METKINQQEANFGIFKNTPESKELISRIICADIDSINYNHLADLIDNCFVVSSLLWRTSITKQITDSALENNGTDEKNNLFNYLYYGTQHIRSKNLKKALSCFEILAYPYDTSMDKNPPFYNTKTNKQTFNVPIRMYDYAAIFAYAKIAILLNKFEIAHKVLLPIGQKCLYQPYPTSLVIPLLLGYLAYGNIQYSPTATYLNENTTLRTKIFNLYEEVAFNTFKQTQKDNIRDVVFDFHIPCSGYKPQIIGPIIISFEQSINATQLNQLIPLIFTHLKVPNKLWIKVTQAKIEEVKKNNFLVKSMQVTFRLLEETRLKPYSYNKNNVKQHKKQAPSKKKEKIKYIEQIISLSQNPNDVRHKNFYNKLMDSFNSLVRSQKEANTRN